MKSKIIQNSLGDNDSVGKIIDDIEFANQIQDQIKKEDLEIRETRYQSLKTRVSTLKLRAKKKGLSLLQNGIV